MQRIHRTALALLFAHLACATTDAAFSYQPIAGPAGGTGKPIYLVGVGIQSDGSLIALDASANAYHTRDTGRTWSAIPLPGTSRLRLFGQVLEEDEGKLTYRSGSWIPRPDPFPDDFCGDSWTSSGGYAGCVAEGGDVVFARSTDTLLTWKPWFRIPASTLEQFDLTQSIDAIGADAGGRIWWQSKTPGLLRGTADGANWIDLHVPPLADIYPRSAFGDTVFIRATNAAGARLGLTTTDGGAHWDSIPESRPGGSSLHRAAPGKWLSTSRDPLTRVSRIHFAPTFRGPWEDLPDSTSGVNITIHGDILITSRGSLAWAIPDPSNLAIPVKGRERTAHLRPGESGWSIRWPAGAPAGRWSLVSTDGRILSHGRLARGQRELMLPALPQAGWLVMPGIEPPLAIPGTGGR